LDASTVRELEVSLQALKEENAMLRDTNRELREARTLDNDEAARLYDFARNKGEALERQAVVAWLRGEPERLVECNGHRHADGKPCWVMSPMPAEELADAIERGEHRREEEP
jgi:hypothetical protein